MNEATVVNTIKNMIREYQRKKLSGHDLIPDLADRIKRSYDEQREFIIQFLIQEFRENRYGLAEIALETIKEMRLQEAGESIYFTYQEKFLESSEDWRRGVIEALLKIRYSAPEGFYMNYFESLKKDDSYLYYLYVLYIFINVEKSIQWLSDFVINCKRHYPKVWQFIKQNIRYLYSYYAEINNLYVLQFLMELRKKDEDAESELRLSLIEYLEMFGKGQTILKELKNNQYLN